MWQARHFLVRVLTYCAAIGMLGLPSTTNAKTGQAVLLIANQAYRWAPLETPTNDVTALAQNFQKLGFAVQQANNLTQNDFFATVDRFVKQNAHVDTLVFFYAGHAVQLNGRNYLIPIDAEIDSPDLLSKLFDLGYLLEQLASIPTKSRLVILDACRSNPFSSAPNASSGLSELVAPPNTLVAFSTSPGNTADDGDGVHSPYTYGLLKYLFQPETRVELAFKSIRRYVRTATENHQIPWESTSLEHDINFSNKSRMATASPGKKNAAAGKGSSGGPGRNQDLCARIFAKYSIGLMSLTPEEQAAASHCK
jgi:uncharacterized caspase-like protein